MSTADARAADEAFARMYEQRRAAGLPLHDAPESTRPPARIVRQRMVDAVRTLYTSTGSVTLSALESYGFGHDDITEHFRPALREARLDRMVA